MPDDKEEKTSQSAAETSPEAGPEQEEKKGRGKVVLTKSAKKLLTKLLKRLGLGLLAEIVPYLGGVAPAWTIAVYYHLNSTPGGFTNPVGLIIFPLALILDLVGLILLCFGLDDFWIADAVGLVFIGGFMIFDVIFQMVFESGGESTPEPEEST